MRLAIAITAVLLAGCGSGVVDRDGSATPPYDGRLDLGAAVAALECDHGKTPYQRGEHGYDDGLAQVQSSAGEALENWMRESAGISAPSEGYAVERERDGRVLLSYDVDGRTKVAMFAADGVRDWNGDTGWGIRAWAQCDPSELPADVTDDLGIGVWEDETGRRVPITRVKSFQGAAHCSWTDITFLLVGPERKADWYVRDVKGEFAGLLHTTVAKDVPLPRGATDTGWRRDGRQLWIGPDEKAAYLVSVDDPEDVHRWPAAKQRIGCA